MIFDAEGVVIDTEPIWDRAQSILLERRGKRYDRDRTKRHLTGRSSAEGIRILIEQYDLLDDPAELASERLQLVHDLAGRVEFMPGFGDFYEKLRPHYLTALASAMDPGLFARVDAQLGLTALFEGRTFLLTGRIRAKPEPDLFLAAAAALGVLPASCVVLEDSPLGIEAAHRAGMTAIGVATTYEPSHLQDADLVISSFAEINLHALHTRAERS